MAEGAVVSAGWLKERLDAPASERDKLSVLDVTWYSDKDATPAFNQKHIPGAVKFDLMHAVTQTALHPRNLPSLEAFQEYVRSLGVDDDTHVVVYDSEGKAGFFLGSRAWWMFKLFGLEKVSVLDGGLQKWEEEGFPVVSGKKSPPTRKGNFTAKLSERWIRSHEDMKENLGKGEFKVLDSRPSEAYSGKPGDPKTGHYPGAISIPFAANLLDKKTNTFKSPEKLKEVLGSLELEKPVVMMCNSGMSSCSLALAAHLLGAKDVAVFHGGFTEWKTKSPDHIEQGGTQ